MKHVDKFGDGFEDWPHYDVPDSVVPFVDEALDRVFELDPQAVLLQVKTKFNELRVYVRVVDSSQEKKIAEIISQLERDVSKML